MFLQPRSRLGMSLIDVSITCSGAQGLRLNQTAVATSSTLYARDLYVSGCHNALLQEGASRVGGPPPGQWLPRNGKTRAGPYKKWFCLFFIARKMILFCFCTEFEDLFSLS